MDERMDIPQLKAFLAEAFAPWVQQLNIQPVEISSTGAVFTVPENADLVRIGGMICGQALAAISDTTAILALMAHNRERRIMTTVDMTNHFLRPAMAGDLEATVAILSNGRRMASARIDIRPAGSPKICAATTCGFAYVEM
ncbi:MAG: PaaI family thioesterase [Alphaproteobacteria bacterium]|nr:PaaI family thioesterase [Alphaproteobacteria bacterium]